jgi:hypothetical protein
MAINVLRGRGRTNPPQAPDELAIGEVDQEIFGCPVCQRPLAVGATRCPGCRTRLLMGRPLRRVAALSALGVAGTAATLVAAVTLMSVIQALAARASAGDGLDPVVTPAPSVPAGGPTTGGPRPAASVSIATRVALDQSVAINVRMLDGAARLRAALGRPTVDSVAVAGILRDLASDATFGTGLVPRIATWSDARDVADELGDLYTAIRTHARAGLSASLTNSRAYRAAAQRMVTVLRRVPTATTNIRTLVTDAGLVLPSLPDLPNPAPSA